MALRDNLVSWWELGEAAGAGDRVDSHGSNDLSAINTPGQGTGKVNANCLDLERSSSEYLEITQANLTGLDVSSDFSVAVWLQTEDNTQRQVIFNKFNGTGNGGYACFYRGDQSPKRWDFGLDNGTTYEEEQSTTQTMTNATWYHFVFVYDESANTVKIYVDNSLLDTLNYTVVTNLAANTNEEFRLGTQQTAALEWDGLVEQFGFWSKALTTDEISELWNGGDGINYAGSAGASFIPKVIGPY